MDVSIDQVLLRIDLCLESFRVLLTDPSAHEPVAVRSTWAEGSVERIFLGTVVGREDGVVGCGESDFAAFPTSLLCPLDQTATIPEHQGVEHERGVGDELAEIPVDGEVVDLFAGVETTSHELGDSEPDEREDRSEDGKRHSHDPAILPE